MKKLTIILLLITSTLFAQEKYEFLNKSIIESVPKEFKKKFKKYNSLSFDNGYLKVYDKKKYFFVNKNFEKTKKLSFATSITRGGFFLTGDRVEGRNDYGKKSTRYIKNLKALKFNGEEVKTDLNKFPNAYLATHQVRVFSFISSKEFDYIVFQNDTENKMFDGLLNNKGEIILDPNKTLISHIIDDYFLIKDISGVKSIFDAANKRVLVSDFDGIVIKEEVYHGKRRLAYGNKIWLKKNGKVGMYNMYLKKWDIPCKYLDIDPFTSWKLVPHPEFSNKTKKAIFTDSYAVKDSNNKWGLVSSNNKILIPFEFYGIERDNLGKITVKNKDGKEELYSFDQE
ncbi:hypothetical protein [Tenacibaculum mesophilum]|uniref:hypothetical protein n=1 Tax=Tenacibaculum mesophilum TaxID=104268 RepID=UPI00064B5E4D|nr:hypothetical protein [Tenacibaculum mesophilum]